MLVNTAPTAGAMAAAATGRGAMLVDMAQGGMILFLCPGLIGPLDAAMPARPGNHTFFRVGKV